jgi:hypothetical protein
MFVIIKMVKQSTSDTPLPVILLNGQEEIMEFDSYESAEDVRVLFENNSDSGHKYIVKKI